MIKIDKISITDSIYPQKLRIIKNPPKQLYYKGNIDLLNTNIISIIGSRCCSENGKILARQFASELAMQGLTIASGMAIGIDAIAHISTLEVNGKTIAVLGNGLNHIFPKENKELYYKIIEQDGLVITEYEPSKQAKSENFLERNRIVSGISLGVLVVEAAHRSGTSVTAKLAKEQGRKVFVLPHEISDIHGVGTNRLIKNGAILITKTKEIIEQFKFLSYRELPKKLIKTKELLLEEKKQEILRKLKKEYQEIYKIIAQKTSDINEICLKTKKPISQINNILFNLEIEGYIEKIAGGYRCILDKN